MFANYSDQGETLDVITGKLIGSEYYIINNQYSENYILDCNFRKLCYKSVYQGTSLQILSIEIQLLKQPYQRAIVA